MSTPSSLPPIRKPASGGTPPSASSPGSPSGSAANTGAVGAASDAAKAKIADAAGQKLAGAAGDKLTGGLGQHAVDIASAEGVKGKLTAGAKAAADTGIRAGLATVTGGASEAVGYDNVKTVARVAGKAGKKGARFLGGGLAIVAGFLVLSQLAVSTPFIPQDPASAEGAPALPGKWGDILLAAQNSSGGNGVPPVPWTVLAGIAENATQFGTCDPYAGTSAVESTGSNVALTPSRVMPGHPRPADADKYTLTTWSEEMLRRLGMPVTPDNVEALSAWARHEGGHFPIGGNSYNGAWYNPLNTTATAEPSSAGFSVNSVGVKGYTSWDVGFDALVRTFRHSGVGYEAILAALSRGNDGVGVVQAVLASSWGTGHIQFRGVIYTKGKTGGVAAGGLQAAYRPCSPPRENLIGGGKDQGSGAFLLTPALASEVEAGLRDDRATASTVSDDVNEAAARALARSIHDAAVRMVSDEGIPYPQDLSVPDDPTNPGTRAGFWARAVDESSAIVDPTAGGGDCTDTPAGSSVATQIRLIWRCEAAFAEQLHVVDSVRESSTGLVFHEMPRAQAVDTLAREAQQVAAGFSQLGAAKCDDGDALAGVFPLSAATAKRFGAPDRCDQTSNIAAAARAVLAGESVPPSLRTIGEGPYSPAIGGWAAIPAALGSQMRGLQAEGPAANWTMPAACVPVARSYIETLIAADPDGFAELGRRAATYTLEDTPPQLVSAVSRVPNTVLGDSSNCAGAARGLATVDLELSSLAQQDAEGTTGSGMLSLDALRLIGASAYFGERGAAADSGDTATWGTDSFVGRLTRSAAILPSVEEADPTGLGQGTAATSTVGTTAATLAARYGGFTRLDKPNGAANAPSTSASPTLAPDAFPADVAAAINAAAARHPDVPLAALAGQILVASGGKNLPASSGKIGPAGWTAVAWAERITPQNWGDGDNDGTQDATNVQDNIEALAAYDDWLLSELAGVPGDPARLLLAAFKTGPADVRAARSVPADAVSYVSAALSKGQGVVQGGPGQTEVDGSGCPVAVPSSRIPGLTLLRDQAAGMDINSLCKKSVAQARTPEAARAIQVALARLGWRYQGEKRTLPFWADCSSFIMRAYTAAGLNTGPYPPTTVALMSSVKGGRLGKSISAREARPGDVLVVYTGSGTYGYHMVMLLSDGLQVHTNSRSDVSRVTKRTSSPVVMAVAMDPALAAKSPVVGPAQAAANGRP